MKLERLELKNFLGVSYANIDLSAPINVLMGENGQGKSSLRDAIEFVMTGGFCESRGFTKKNQSPLLAYRNNSNGKLKVALHTDQGIYERKGGANGSTGNTPSLDRSVARIAVNPQSVLDMTAKDRQEVFSLVLAGNQDDNTKVSDCLEKHGFSAEVIARVDESMDTAQEWAIEQRKSLKRVVKESDAAVENEASPSKVDVNGTPIDLSDINIDQYRSRLTQRTDERDKLIGQKASIESEIDKITSEVDPDELETMTSILQTQEAALKSIDLTEAKKDLDAANEKVSDNKYEHLKHVNESSRLTQEKTQLESAIKEIKALKGECPTCHAKITKEGKGDVVATLTNQLDKAKKGITAANIDCNEADKLFKIAVTYQKSRHDEYDTLVISQMNLENEISRLSRQVEMASRYTQLNATLETLPALLDEVEGFVTSLNTVINAHIKYMADVNTRDMAQENINKHKADIERMDLLDSLLKPDGEVRMIANEQIESAQFDAELKEIWGMDSLVLESDGTINLHGAPIESACTTEKYRAGVLLAELLSRTMGLGILIIDDFDKLKGELKDALFTRIHQWSDVYETIVVFSAVDEMPELRSSEECGAYWVNNGTVEIM